MIYLNPNQSLVYFILLAANLTTLTPVASVLFVNIFVLICDSPQNVTWKRPVKGVREMCDVCKTTLFNYHWICGMCGLFVCLDCYQFRRGGLVKDKSENDKNTDDYKWPYCTTGWCIYYCFFPQKID